MVLDNSFIDDRKITLKRLRLGLLYILSFGVPLVLHQLSFYKRTT